LDVPRRRSCFSRHAANCRTFATAPGVVGSECVKSFIDTADPVTALRMWKGHWTQRRSYYYKRAQGQAWIVGQRDDGPWWAAQSPSVKEFPWAFFPEKFFTADDANRFVAQQLCS
jgi:hypothetical protein